ncbi:MAG TPA: hypothetical protein VEC76_12510 [Streptosporangiaceae bacterium]|nr:hypothetical protein [Streptosporangiaceae bacterium]
MTEDLRPGRAQGPVTAAGREARWTLRMRLAVEAASAADAQAITGETLARLGRELPLRGRPAIQPLGLQDGIWVATAEPDLTGLAEIEPDRAETRVRYVSSHFPEDVLWTVRVTGHQAKWEWPPDIWSRRPGHDDVLLHPAVRAVSIWCEAT